MDKDRDGKKDHPAATGVGAVVGGVGGGLAGGAAAGAAIGGMTGPVGAAVGAVVGAAAGALAGRGMARAADPDVEDKYWRENYNTRSYAQGSSYDDYAPAYRHGVDAFNKYPDKTYDDVERDLGNEWPQRRGSSSLEWERAKHATKDAWHKLSNTVERAVPGDSDRDGR